MTGWILLAILVGFLLAVAVRDRYQNKHTILRNFPLVGHARFALEKIGPELRQYIVAHNREEQPFTRSERSWVYASSKGENNYFGFGTEIDLDTVKNHVIITPAAFSKPTPAKAENHIPARAALGGYHNRAKAFTPQSIVNISGMSYGALSGRAIEAMNKGAAAAGALHCTGEGGISEHHLHGGDLIYQIGTGYFGCRNLQGQFSLEKLLETIDGKPVKALEIKLSQGAKAGLGGMLPGAKVTEEIARVRGVEPGKDCISPSHHSAFSNVPQMLEFIETLAQATGLPVGIKSAVGNLEFWQELSTRMAEQNIGPDYIQIDGGEGGTGAAPLAFTDHVALPYKLAQARVYKTFLNAGAAGHTQFIGSGKLGLPETGMLAFALGADMLAVGREAMLAVGCIQAQKCHTGHCPTGVATQNTYLARGLDPANKAQRVTGYIQTLRHELLMLAAAAGLEHPADITANQVEILNGQLGSTSAAELFGYPRH